MKSSDTETPSVGIREFRAELTEYIEADGPVTITRHGQVVGLFIPLRRPSAEDVQRMLTAAANAREILPLSEEQVEAAVADFDALRRGQSLPGSGAK